MKNLFKRLYEAATHKNELAAIRQQLNILSVSVNAADTHIVALMRLSLIKPEALYHEITNTKANTDYLLQLIEIKKNADADISAKN
jgi:hypothetical protein